MGEMRVTLKYTATSYCVNESCCRYTIECIMILHRALTHHIYIYLSRPYVTVDLYADNPMNAQRMDCPNKTYLHIISLHNTTERADLAPMKDLFIFKFHLLVQ